MSAPLEHLRGTGRTTRMLKHAENLARAGRAVYVVADNERDRRRLMVEFQGMDSLGVKFETPETLGNFDWKTLRSRGAHTNCVFLVDHHAIEDRFAAVIEMLHQFDKP